MKQDGDYDPRIPRYIEVTEQLIEGNFDVPPIPADPSDPIGRLGLALRSLAEKLEMEYRRLQRLDQITSDINAGLLLEEILEKIYRDFREFIPYNRIGFSVIEEDGTRVRARWARSDAGEMQIAQGYSASLAGSSLEMILRTGTPRIINDLEEYLRAKPDSESTQKIVREGMRSSLTCPLIANGVPVGFMFFSSRTPHMYDHVHVEIFQRIANQLSVILEKGRLVSELAMQKSAIERQNEELRKLNELKVRFLSMAIHDLRHPLAVIQMAADLLLDDSLSLSDEHRSRFMLDIDNQAKHMLALIEDLLSVSQFETGRLELWEESLDVKLFLEEAITRHSGLAAPKGTRVILGSVPPGEVIADRRRLRQVIDNLISNAVKYSPAGSTVQVWAEQTPTHWCVYVRDEGPGIREEDRAKLFQYFSRLNVQPTGGESSTGLGLAISRQVIEAHGGEIDVISEPGMGSTFWFTLPIKPPWA